MIDINMKNMVVLKNLPSNIVDQAFVVFKSTKNAKKLEKIEQNKAPQNNNANKNKDYFLKEAEMLVNDYIDKIEKNDNRHANKKKDITKKTKLWAYISTGIAIAELIILMNN